MKQIKNTILVGGLLISTLALGTACSKSNDVTLYDYEATALTLKSLSLSSESNASLSGYTFSIENKDGEGLITNTRPLPYGVSLSDLKLRLTPENGSASIQVAVGDGAFEDWKSDKKYTLSSGADYLRVKLSEGSYSYTYKVKLNVYAYDPETIRWEKLSLTEPNMLETQGIAGTVFEWKGDRIFVDTHTGYYYRIDEAAGRLVRISAIPGIGGSGVFRTLVSSGSEVYSVGLDGKLYRLGDASWEQVVTTKYVELAYGLLPNYSAGQRVKSRIALLVRDTDGTKRTASLDLETGEMKLSKQPLPERLPVNTTSHFFRSFSDYKSLVGGSMHLYTTALETNASTGRANVVHETFYTVDGLTYVPLGATLQDGEDTISDFLEVGNLTYRLEYSSSLNPEGRKRGLIVSTSSDKGRSWRASGEVAYTGLGDNGLGNTAVFAIWGDTSGNIWLQAGTTGELWKGIPLKNVTQ